MRRRPESTVLFCYPRHARRTRPASCTTFICLCNSFKELLLLASAHSFWAKAGAKVHTFRIPTKFFGNYFQGNAKVFGIYDKRARQRKRPKEPEVIKKLTCAIYIIMWNYILRRNSEHTIAVAIATLRDSAELPTENEGISRRFVTYCRMSCDMPLPSLPMTIIPCADSCWP